RIDGRGGLLGRVGGLVEHPDLEGHALPRGRFADALNRRMVERLGHGRSLRHDPERGAGAGRPSASIAPVEAILFDWDGTLVDSLGAFHSANAAVMAAFGLPFDAVAYRKHYVPDWREMYRRLGVPPDRLDEANTLWEQAFAGDGERVVAFPGAVPALTGPRRAGGPWGRVTAGTRPVAEPQLVRTGPDQLLPVRVFGEALPVHKPDPEPLRRALAMAGHGRRPEASAYVGDAPT